MKYKNKNRNKQTQAQQQHLSPVNNIRKNTCTVTWCQLIRDKRIRFIDDMDFIHFNR